MTTQPSDRLLRDVLAKPAEFACVGLSANPVRPSYFVGRYLALKGYGVTAINPGLAGQELFGRPCMADLADLAAANAPAPDILDLFRRPEAVPPLVEQGLALFPGLRCVWLQIGVISAEAEAMCAAANVPIIQNRCPKIEYQRLFGELRQGGIATGLISSRLPRRDA